MSVPGKEAMLMVSRVPLGVRVVTTAFVTPLTTDSVNTELLRFRLSIGALGLPMAPPTVKPPGPTERFPDPAAVVLLMLPEQATGPPVIFNEPPELAPRVRLTSETVATVRRQRPTVGGT